MNHHHRLLPLLLTLALPALSAACAQGEEQLPPATTGEGEGEGEGEVGNEGAAEGEGEGAAQDCVPGTTQPCGRATGECSLGTRTCNAQGSWDDCIGAVEPLDEVCDGLDNDCDDATDEELMVPERCPLRTGVCRGIRPTCAGADGWVCRYPETMEPEPETRCDGLDNDCDGLTDEQLSSELTCLTDGVCAEVAPVCLGEPGWGCPYPPEYEAETELTCDGLDNDCDGVTDEGALTVPVEFACPATGVCQQVEPVCDQGGWTCPRPAQHEDPEATCDGLDNDCDGQTDENLNPPAEFTCREQLGVCAAATPACQAGHWSCSTAGLRAHEPVEQSCDDLDNDCDGLTDEELVPADPPCRLKQGICREAGTNVCWNGQWLCADPPDREAEEQTCDGLDNDCDGATDEAESLIPLGACPPRLGICADHVPEQPECLAGRWDCRLPPTYLADEGLAGQVCDGLDNDCDGATDEGLAYIQENGRVVGFGQWCDGIGECGDGLVECLAGELVCSTDPRGSAYVYVAELCNGYDDDCDGRVPGNELEVDGLRVCQLGVRSALALGTRTKTVDSLLIRPDHEALFLSVAATADNSGKLISLRPRDHTRRAQDIEQLPHTSGALHRMDLDPATNLLVLADSTAGGLWQLFLQGSDLLDSITFFPFPQEFQPTEILLIQREGRPVALLAGEDDVRAFDLTLGQPVDYTPAGDGPFLLRRANNAPIVCSASRSADGTVELMDFEGEQLHLVELGQPVVALTTLATPAGEPAAYVVTAPAEQPPQLCEILPDQADPRCVSLVPDPALPELDPPPPAALTTSPDRSLLLILRGPTLELYATATLEQLRTIDLTEVQLEQGPLLLTGHAPRDLVALHNNDGTLRAYALFGHRDGAAPQDSFLVVIE